MASFFNNSSVHLFASIPSCCAHVKCVMSYSLFVIVVCQYFVVLSLLATLFPYHGCCLMSLVPILHAICVLLSSIYSSRKCWDLDLSSSPYLVNPGWLSPRFSNRDPFSSACVSLNLPAPFSVCGDVEGRFLRPVSPCVIILSWEHSFIHIQLQKHTQLEPVVFSVSLFVIILSI